MENYEYQVYEFYGSRIFFMNDSSQIDELNNLGKDGWEVAMIDGSHCLLKRRISN